MGKEFKIIFDRIAQKNGFIKAFGGWYIENSFSILVLDLQKSNFSNLFYLNIKIYIRGIFGNNYVVDKYLVKNDTGDVFLRQPQIYNDIFDLENSLDGNQRTLGLERLFCDYLIPFSTKVMTKNGLMKLSAYGEIRLLPAVEKELK